LSVLLFNWVGFRLFTAFWEDRAATTLEAGLDRNEYDSNELILLRVAADALPYSNCSSDFERTTGIIEIGNLRYREVKRRLYNDSVEFLCIPDGAVNRLRSAGNEFFSLVNDLQKTGHDKHRGPHGKTIHSFYKIVYYSAQHFPNLRYFAAHSIRSPRFQHAGLSAGHPRMGLRPPRIDIFIC
jgi:hypothetical protein